jgi:hypothetical protein
MHYYKQVKLGEPLYIKTQKETQEKEVKDRITWEDMMEVVNEKAEILSLYGGMVRNLKNSHDLLKVGISMDYIRRSLAAQIWWKKGHRILSEEYPYELTKPEGFQ